MTYATFSTFFSLSLRLNFSAVTLDDFFHIYEKFPILRVPTGKKMKSKME